MSRWRLLTGTSTGSQTVPPRVVEVRASVGQLHEVAEVLDRAVAPAVVEVAHERRAVVRREDRVRRRRSATFRSRVAGVLGELARRGRLDDLAAHAAREADPLALRRRRRPSRNRRERVRVAAELDADLLEDRVGVVLDERRGPPRRGPRTARACGSGTASRSAWACEARRAWRAARPPDRRRGAVVDHRSSSSVRPRRPPAAPSRRVAAPAGRVGRSARGRQVDDRGRGAGTAAVRCGNAIASTKCSWKRGSTAVSIFSTRRTTRLDLAPGGARQQRDQRAGARRRCRPSATRSRSQSGIEPEDHRVERVDLAAERAGQPDLVDRLDAERGPSAAATPA